MIVIADQGTKLWALEALADGIPYQALGRFLMFSLVFNEGGAMGTQLAPSIGYLIMALIVLPFVLFYLYRNRFYPAVSLPLAFIAGGAIGNLIDRIRLGRVVDFIDVDFFDINVAGFQLERWWTFNIADAAISCAIVFLIGHMILNRHTLDPEKPDQPAPETPSSDRA